MNGKIGPRKKYLNLGTFISKSDPATNEGKWRLTREFFYVAGCLLAMRIIYSLTKNTLTTLWDLGEFHHKNPTPPTGPHADFGVRAPGSYVAQPSILSRVPTNTQVIDESVDKPKVKKEENPELEHSWRGWMTSTENKNNFAPINQNTGIINPDEYVSSQFSSTSCCPSL